MFAGMVDTVPVKMNIEVGAGLRSVIQAEAKASHRRDSPQIGFYVSKALEHVESGGSLAKNPSDTLDDNGGKMTPYFPETTWSKIESRSDDLGVGRSAYVRALIYTGIALCRTGNAKS